MRTSSRQLGERVPGCIYVPIGGGGLLAGVSAATRHLSPATRVIGVEPELEADAWQSFHAGELRRLDGPSDSIADAVKVQELGRLTWPLIRDCVDDVVTVTEADIAGGVPARGELGAPRRRAGRGARDRRSAPTP